VTVARSLFD